MGDIAEMYQAWEFDYPYDDDREEEYAARGIWPAKTGEIPVTNMDDTHLANALAYIQKNSLNSPLQDMLEREIKRRSWCVEVTDPAVKDDEKEIFFLEVREVSISAWAIRQKSTGYYLPDRKNKRGYSFDEPTKDCFPRLFKSKLSAIHALSAWLRGHWKVEWHQRGGFSFDDAPEDVQVLETEMVEGRNADDMEIVEFALHEVAK